MRPPRRTRRFGFSGTWQNGSALAAQWTDAGRGRTRACGWSAATADGRSGDPDALLAVWTVDSACGVVRLCQLSVAFELSRTGSVTIMCTRTAPPCQSVRARHRPTSNSEATAGRHGRRPFSGLSAAWRVAHARKNGLPTAGSFIARRRTCALLCALCAATLRCLTFRGAGERDRPGDLEFTMDLAGTSFA